MRRLLIITLLAGCGGGADNPQKDVTADSIRREVLADFTTDIAVEPLRDFDENTPADEPVTFVAQTDFMLIGSVRSDASFMVSDEDTDKPLVPIGMNFSRLGENPLSRPTLKVDGATADLTIEKRDASGGGHYYLARCEEPAEFAKFLRAKSITVEMDGEEHDLTAEQLEAFRNLADLLDEVDKDPLGHVKKWRAEHLAGE